MNEIITMIILGSAFSVVCLTFKAAGIHSGNINKVLGIEE
jgi:hypothetical protein